MTIHLTVIALLLSAGADSNLAATPTAQVIEQAIKDLGSIDFQTREKAEMTLWKAGRAAEPALEAVLKTGDAEIKFRARRLLTNFKYGIFPDTPKDAIAKIMQYRNGSRSQKMQILNSFQRAKQLKILLRLVTAEPDEKLKREFAQRYLRDSTKIVPLMLSNGDVAGAERLLQLLSLASEAGLRDYAVFILLTGKQQAKIAELEIQEPRSDQSQKLLMQLLRLAGETNRARALAEQAGNEAVLRQLLFADGDWTALAQLQSNSNGASANFANLEIESLGRTAAYHRMAGSEKAMTNAIRALRVRAELRPSDTWSCAEALMINERLDDAIELLKNKNRIDAFKLLVRQNRCIEALEMVGLDVPNEEMMEKINSSFDALKDEASLAIEIASLLHRLGETKPAGQLFDLLVKESVSTSEKRLYDVCAAEYRVGRVDEAFAHIEPITLGSAGGVLRQLFSKRLDVATVWWSYFSQAHPNEPRRQTLKRVHTILSPKSGIRIEHVKQLAARAAEFSKFLDLRAHWLEKISETIALHGDAKLAHTYLQDSAKLQPTSTRLMKLGDSQARLTQWKEAAETYGKVWEMDQSEPLALYLQGWATTQSGEEARGDGLKQRAKLLPLGNTRHRFVLAEGLQKRGLRQAADRQFEMVTRLGSGNDRFMLNAAKILGNSIYPTNRFQAAKYWQQLLLSCLRTNTRFGEIEGYLQLPHIINKAQARGFLEQGKTELAAAAANRSHAIIPGETRLAIDLVPEFDKAQSGKFADELFAKIYAVNFAICERFPNSASHHNNLAWMAAKCHRRIDDALKLAQRATTLQPENSGYLDTLAELHFLAGDRDKAIELAQRCLKFDAKNVHYQEQLERFRKAPK